MDAAGPRTDPAIGLFALSLSTEYSTADRNVEEMSCDLVSQVETSV